MSIIKVMKEASLKKQSLYKVINILDSNYRKSDLYILKYIVNYYKNISNEINYLLYIFFYIIPTSRRLIQDIQDKSRIYDFGKLCILYNYNFNLWTSRIICARIISI